MVSAIGAVSTEPAEWCGAGALGAGDSGFDEANGDGVGTGVVREDGVGDGVIAKYLQMHCLSRVHTVVEV